MLKKTKKFFGEVIVELKKVSWPTRPELISSSWIVIIITVILGLYVGAVDLALSKLLRLMIR